MDTAIKPNLYKGLVAAGALGASVLINKSMDFGWKKITKEDPPRDPFAPNISWKKVILWTILTSVFVGLGRLFVEKATYMGWAKGYGEDPKKY